MIRYLSISLFKIQDFSLHYLLTGGGLVLSSPGVVFGSGTLVGIGGGGVVGGAGGAVEGSGGGGSVGGVDGDVVVALVVVVVGFLVVVVGIGLGCPRKHICTITSSVMIQFLLLLFCAICSLPTKACAATEW